MHTIPLRPLLASACCLLAACTLTSPARSEIAIVASKTFNGYQRERAPDGRFKEQTYTFGDGGLYRATTVGTTVDDVPFLKLAHTLSPFLRDQGFIPCGDPDQTELLILVSRGTTLGSESLRESTFTYLELGRRESQGALDRSSQLREGQVGNFRVNREPDAVARARGDQASMSYLMAVNAESEMRDRMDYKNATLLGLGADMEHALLLSYTAFGRDIAEDVGFNRYFVVVSAYDFKAAWKEKKMKKLWETRYSIREHGNDFTRQLPYMTQTASRYFGRDTHGFARRPLAEDIRVGQPKVIDYEPAP